VNVKAMIKKNREDFKRQAKEYHGLIPEAIPEEQ
jgi:hypothetical protein